MYYEHRAWAELKLGRPLRPGEVVHHQDNIKTNNHPGNIIIFSNQSALMLYKNYQKREQQGITHLFTLEKMLEFSGLWMVK